MSRSLLAEKQIIAARHCNLKAVAERFPEWFHSGGVKYV
jgi:hypothetical protein